MTENEHYQAQAWGLLFVCWFILTGIGAETARKQGLPVFSLEHRCHLNNCWEETCHEVREMVDGTNLYTVSQYVSKYYFREALVKFGILPKVPKETMLFEGVEC